MITLTSAWKKRGVQIKRNGRLMGELLYRLSHKGRLFHPRLIECGRKATVRVDFGTALLSDTIKEKDDLLVVERQWTVYRPGSWRLLFTYRPSLGRVREWCVPAVMYNGNEQGKGFFPNGGLERGWSFREDRIPVPSCSLLLDREGCAQALFCSPAAVENEISSIKSSLEGGKPTWEISIPFTEEPFTYREKGILLGGLSRKSGHFFQLKFRQLPYIYRRTFYLLSAPDIQGREQLYSHIFRIAWRELQPKTTESPGAADGLQATRGSGGRHGPAEPGAAHASSAAAAGVGAPRAEPPEISGATPRIASSTAAGSASPAVDWSALASLKLNHLLFLVHDRKGITGLWAGRGNGLFQSFYNYLSGSFLVKSLEAAVILAKAGRELQAPGLFDLAERMGNFFLGGGLDNGLHQDTFIPRKGSWVSYAAPGAPAELTGAVNARCNGEVMCAYLRLYELLKQEGRRRPDFLETAERNGVFYFTQQLTGEQEGSFGRWWSKEGKPLNTLGTNGAYIISLLCLLEKLTHSSPRRQQALERAAAYYTSLIDQGAFYGDTLDADCVDKEAGSALLRAFLDLYEWQAKPEYLEAASKAASFLLSWLWTYNVPWPKGCPAAGLELKTRGLTSVSVSHHHLDFYGLAIGYDFLRLARAGAPGPWREYAHAMIEACGQLVATPQQPLGRGSSFRGWQPEQLNQTDWDYRHHWLGAKGRFHTCAAWTVVLTLGALLDIREHFPEVINFTFSRDNFTRGIEKRFL